MFRIPGVTSVLRLPRFFLQRALLESSSATGAEVEQEVPVKQNFDNEQTRIKITLPRWSVGPLIGPKHENLIQMEKDCKTNLQLSKWEHFFPGSLEQVLLIEGETENVLKTIHKIYDTVRVMDIPESDNPNPNRKNLKRRQNSIRLVSPLSFAEDLKGLKRENESHTKTKFKLDQFKVVNRQPYIGTDFKERVIHIGGDEENVKDAVGFLVERLSSGPQVDSNLNYQLVDKLARIKITVPQWSVGPLIGLQGENQTQMEKDCKTNLQYSANGHFFPGSLERVLLIEGEAENVLKTIHKIYDTVRVMEISESVDNPDAVKTRQNVIRLVTPLSFAERENESHTKTKFKLDQFNVVTRKQYDKDFKERVILIRGDEENVKDAVGFVVERLSSGPQVDRNLKYQLVNKLTRIKITLPRWSVGPLVGPKYENLIQMEKDCKTNLQLSKWGHFFPGSREPVLLIEGETENVLKTIHKIYDTVRMMEIPESVDNADAAKRRQNGIHLVTPLTFAEDLKGIERENESHTKTKFNLDQFNVLTRKQYHEDFKERLIHICGDEENVKMALSSVIESLSSGYNVDRNLSYRQFYFI